jgi:hypothetical protein
VEEFVAGFEELGLVLSPGQADSLVRVFAREGQDELQYVDREA